LYVFYRCGMQVTAGLDPNGTVNAWGGPTYLGAMAFHYFDGILMLAAACWLLALILLPDRQQDQVALLIRTAPPPQLTVPRATRSHPRRTSLGRLARPHRPPAPAASGQRRTIVPAGGRICGIAVAARGKIRAVLRRCPAGRRPGALELRHSPAQVMPDRARVHVDLRPLDALLVIVGTDRQAPLDHHRVALAQAHGDVVSQLPPAGDRHVRGGPVRPLPGGAVQPPGSPGHPHRQVLDALTDGLGPRLAGHIAGKADVCLIHHRDPPEPCGTGAPLAPGLPYRRHGTARLLSTVPGRHRARGKVAAGVDNEAARPAPVDGRLPFRRATWDYAQPVPRPA